MMNKNYTFFVVALLVVTVTSVFGEIVDNAAAIKKEDVVRVVAMVKTAEDATQDADQAVEVKSVIVDNEEL